MEQEATVTTHAQESAPAPTVNRGEFACPNCGRVFNWKPALAAHAKTHEPNYTPAQRKKRNTPSEKTGSGVTVALRVMGKDYSIPAFRQLQAEVEAVVADLKKLGL